MGKQQDSTEPSQGGAFPALKPVPHPTPQPVSSVLLKGYVGQASATPKSLPLLKPDMQQSIFTSDRLWGGRLETDRPRFDCIPATCNLCEPERGNSPP